jgi:pyruvate,orthophosphate dikinase
MMDMEEKRSDWYSTALQVNLERTAAVVEIPATYQILLEAAKDHYGVLKRTRELLTELNHPYVNWDYVLTQLKTLSVGDFYDFNNHRDGLNALKMFAGIYVRVISSTASEDVRDSAVRYLFEYMNMILTHSGEFLERNLSLFPAVFDLLLRVAEDDGFLLKKSSGYFKTILSFAVEHDTDFQTGSFELLLYNVFRITYTFWLTQPDPVHWLPRDGSSREMLDLFGNLVRPITHENISLLSREIGKLHNRRCEDAKELFKAYSNMPDFSQIVNAYSVVADELERQEAFAGRHYLVKLDFLFNVMNVSGLSDIHNNTLLEINRCLGKVFREENSRNLHDFVRKVFLLLKKNVSAHQYQTTIIDCITTFAKGVFEQNSHPLVDTFIDELIAFGFQPPDVKGSNAEWQVQVNPAHIKNIRAWLEIISLKPRWTKRLLSAFIINLKLHGVFVRDTDLLQRDISALLGSDITPAYNLVKQLLRIFPVYFTEIGAEGELRDISTRVDELTMRNDKLVYFLRKQSHVESNSLLVPFIEDIFRYWYSGDRECVKKHLPQEVFEQVRNSGEYFDGMHQIFIKLFLKVDDDVHGFLEWDIGKIRDELHQIQGVSERDKERAVLMIRLHQLLFKKYNYQPIDLLKDLEASCMFKLSKIRTLRHALNDKNIYRALVVTMELLFILKEKILSPEKIKPFENIYYKRHIAAGIPSMYGTYKEEKFEAMGLTFRLENLAGVLFQRLVESLNLKFITKSTLTMVNEYLWVYVKALELEGIATEGLVSKMKYISSALQVRQFSIDQYIDIFQFISKGIQDIIRNYYIDAHRSNLLLIVNQMLQKDDGTINGREKTSDEELVYRYSENFIRSMISSAFGLQVFDNFVNNIIKNLSAELEKFKDNKQILNLVMAYIPELAISSIYKKNEKMDNQILIGNKGYFLKELVSFDFPVPPGFIITTEVFRGYDAVVGYKYIFKDLSLRIHNEIIELERLTNRKFGDPGNPLLLSVRSGATISLPGMMHSFLNVGINEAIAEGLSKKKHYQWAAWDSYRRFLQTWGMFKGLERNVFDDIINNFKEQYNVTRKIQFYPEQMKQLALSYRDAMRRQGVEIADDPAEQLQQAILQVFDSWYSEQAKTYRHQMHLSDEWGTAVIVQSMVFGNLDQNSGSGVIFTRDPKGSSANVTLYGDFIFGVQGDDIVSGLVETFPISERQRLTERPDSDISLERKFPDIYHELMRLVEVLIYEKGFNHQEIEFTFENAAKKGLYILQTRDMIQRETKKRKTFRETKKLLNAFLGAGIGVSGGALCGRAVFSENEIIRFRSEEPDTPLILIRPDTVPDDVGILLQVEGLLTARGGGTSHAAVTIPQLQKVGVVGFGKLKVYESESFCIIDGRKINGGDFICIDGWSGSVYYGRHESDTEESYQIGI